MSLTVDSGQTLQRCLALDIGGTKIAVMSDHYPLLMTCLLPLFFC